MHRPVCVCSLGSSVVYKNLRQDYGILLSGERITEIDDISVSFPTQEKATNLNNRASKPGETFVETIVRKSEFSTTVRQGGRCENGTPRNFMVFLLRANDRGPG